MNSLVADFGMGIGDSAVNTAGTFHQGKGSDSGAWTKISLSDMTNDFDVSPSFNKNHVGALPESTKQQYKWPQVNNNHST